MVIADQKKHQKPLRTRSSIYDVWLFRKFDSDITTSEIIPSWCSPWLSQPRARSQPTASHTTRTPWCRAHSFSTERYPEYNKVIFSLNYSVAAWKQNQGLFQVSSAARGWTLHLSFALRTSLFPYRSTTSSRLIYLIISAQGAFLTLHHWLRPGLTVTLNHPASSHTAF